MSKPKRELSVDEKRLWREVAKTVKSRRATPEEGVEARAPRPQSPNSAAPTSVRNKQTASVTLAPPAHRGSEKRVRRGRVDIGAKLDLHGHTYDSAQPALAKFLREAQNRGHRTVIVVTGAGRSGEGVLKKSLPGWLGALRAIVSGYAPAHRTHGGGGAFYVFLKRRE